MFTIIIMAVAMFVAMGLMRYSLRQGKRREYEGIRWRGLNWERVDQNASSEGAAHEPDADS